MKVSVELDVKGCRDCPFLGSHCGQGDTDYSCNYPGKVMVYINPDSTPKKCPLGLGEKQ